MITERIVFLADVHDCHIDWYGVSTRERMEKLVRDFNEAQGERPVDRLMILGDVSLDYWEWSEKGSYLRNPPISNTAHFMENYFPKLPGAAFIIPGNHEQYGYDKWLEITGYPRSYVVEGENCIFVMLDNFAGNLAPSEHSDGTYTMTDCEMVERVLESRTDKPIILCAHYFDMQKESESFKSMLASNERIIALAIGHTHRSEVITSGDDAGNKPILQCGNYSYSGNGDGHTFWGWRELIFEDNGLVTSFYNVPEVSLNYNGEKISVKAHHQDEWQIKIKRS